MRSIREAIATLAGADKDPLASRQADVLCIGSMAFVTLRLISSGLHVDPIHRHGDEFSANYRMVTHDLLHAGIMLAPAGQVERIVHRPIVACQIELNELQPALAISVDLKIWTLMAEVHPEPEDVDVGEVTVHIETDGNAVRQGKESLADQGSPLIAAEED